MQPRNTTILYLVVALFTGLIAGLFLRGAQLAIVLIIISSIGIAAIIAYMNGDTHEPESKESVELAGMPDEPEKVLSKEEARQWLDDFLVDHQKHKK